MRGFFHREYCPLATCRGRSNPKMKSFRFIILGAGPSGLAFAHTLLNCGEDSFLVLEKEGSPEGFVEANWWMERRWTSGVDISWIPVTKKYSICYSGFYQRQIGMRTAEFPPSTSGERKLIILSRQTYGSFPSMTKLGFWSPSPRPDVSAGNPCRNLLRRGSPGSSESASHPSICCLIIERSGRRI